MNLLILVCRINVRKTTIMMTGILPPETHRKTTRLYYRKALFYSKPFVETNSDISEIDAIWRIAHQKRVDIRNKSSFIHELNKIFRIPGQSRQAKIISSCRLRLTKPTGKDNTNQIASQPCITTVKRLAKRDPTFLLYGIDSI